MYNKSYILLILSILFNTATALKQSEAHLVEVNVDKTYLASLGISVDP